MKTNMKTNMKTISYNKYQAREIILQTFIDNWRLAKVVIVEDSYGEDIELITEDCFTDYEIRSLIEVQLMPKELGQSHEYFWSSKTVGVLLDYLKGAEAREKTWY